MSERIKYTKTSTFLFPLTEVPKTSFICNIKNGFKKTILTSRFFNSYIKDFNLDNNIFNDGPYIFVVINSYQDKEFDKFYSTIVEHANYVDEYIKNDFIVMIFSISQKYLDDYELIMNGKYSIISEEAKEIIMRNYFFRGQPGAIPLILNKSKKLKETWEERLSIIAPGTVSHSPADLKNQEVYPILTEKLLNESITKETLQSKNKSNSILLNSSEFDSN
jgi:hypothetical protein